MIYSKGGQEDDDFSHKWLMVLSFIYFFLNDTDLKLPFTARISTPTPLEDLAARRGPGWSGMSPCLQGSCSTQPLCSRWKPMSCQDAHTIEPQDLQVETVPIFCPKPGGLIEGPLHNPASQMSWDCWADNRRYFLNPLGWGSLVGHPLPHSAFTQTKQLLTAICQTSITRKHLFVLRGARSWLWQAGSNCSPNGATKDRRATVCSWRCGVYQTTALEEPGAHPNLPSTNLGVPAGLGFLWGHQAQHKHKAHFVQTVPVITSWTNVERKAFNFPKYLQQSFFLLISFVLAKKILWGSNLPYGKQKNQHPNCQS